MTQPLAPGLYIVATPIGNLADITIRSATTLVRAARVYCEDTRQTRRLLDALGINRPLKVYHDHNGDAVRPEILAAIADGEVIALVSDAGTPVISDPGFKLVRAVLAADHPVFAVPGPSALTAALSISGLPSDQVLFAGFLPAKAQARRARLDMLATTPATLIFYEAPQRLADMLAEAAEALGLRDAVVARELTKAHEELKSGTLPELAEWAASERMRGEFVVVIGPARIAKAEVTDDELTRQLRAALPAEPLAAAAKRIAAESGVAKARVYALGLALKSADEQDEAE